MAKGDDIEERLIDFAVRVITLVWLKIITRSSMFSEPKMRPINQECGELCRIINASITTTKAR